MKRLRTAGFVLLALAALLALATWATLRLPSFGGSFEGERLERMRQSKQFVDGRFENAPPYVSDGLIASMEGEAALAQASLLLADAAVYRRLQNTQAVAYAQRCQGAHGSLFD